MKDFIKARQRKARKGQLLDFFYGEYFLTSETQQYTMYTRLKKSTNPYLQKDHVRLY